MDVFSLLSSGSTFNYLQVLSPPFPAPYYILYDSYYIRGKSKVHRRGSAKLYPREANFREEVALAPSLEEWWEFVGLRRGEAV